jgi:hypothetical protein
MPYQLDEMEEAWGGAELLPVREVASALEVSERWVLRAAQRRHLFVPVLPTRGSHLTKSGARFLCWVPSAFALELAKELAAQSA